MKLKEFIEKNDVSKMKQILIDNNLKDLKDNYEYAASIRDYQKYKDSFGVPSANKLYLDWEIKKVGIDYIILKRENNEKK